MNACRIERLGDAALLLRVGDGIDAAINRRVHACARALHAHAPEWLLDITPAYACLALHVDISCVHGASASAGDPLEIARHWLIDWLASTDIGESAVGARAIEIPVAYGGEYGPDLPAVAAHAGITEDEAIARHASAGYTVAMLGFAPGFPYLTGLDASLAMPRLDTPRTRVAAGSVGIGGAQTGIYPDTGPGGWRLLGRTPLRLFDAHRDPPSLLQAGDRVLFVAIDSGSFDAMIAAR